MLALPRTYAWRAAQHVVCRASRGRAVPLTTTAPVVATAADVFGLGLKSWAATKIDTVKDGECILETKPGFATMRMPDSISAFTLDGKDYLLFAEEGDDYTYGDFEDKQKFKDVVKSATEFEDDFADFVAGAGMADAFSNFGDTKMRVSIGPRAVDYSDPAAPVFEASLSAACVMYFRAGAPRATMRTAAACAVIAFFWPPVFVFALVTPWPTPDEVVVPVKPPWQLEAWSMFEGEPPHIFVKSFLCGFRCITSGGPLRTAPARRRSREAAPAAGVTGRPTTPVRGRRRRPQRA